MTLKSYRLKTTMNKKSKRRKSSSTGDIVKAGTTAIFGTALISTIASSLK